MAGAGTQRDRIRKIGYPLDSDVIVPNKDELLYVATKAGQGRCPWPIVGHRAAGQSRHSRWPAAAASPPSRASRQHARWHQPAHDYHLSLIADVGLRRRGRGQVRLAEEYLMALERKHLQPARQTPRRRNASWDAPNRRSRFATDTAPETPHEQQFKTPTSLPPPPPIRKSGQEWLFWEHAARRNARQGHAGRVGQAPGLRGQGD